MTEIPEIGKLPETESARVELLRSKSLEELEVVVHLLEEAGIACRVSSVKASNNYTQLGHLDEPDDGVVTVAQADFRAARDVLESAYAKEELPEGHFLRTGSDEDVLAVLAEPDDWSPFDVAHARRLAQERGLDLSQQKAVVEELRKNYEEGVPAPRWLIILGWIMVVVSCGTDLGLIFSVGIGYRIGFWKVDRALGGFYLYDEPSRRTGKVLFYTAIVVGVAWHLLILLRRMS